MAGIKRSADDSVSFEDETPVVGVSRSISACKLCRKRKAKCDKAFPKCGRCLRKGEECIGLDAATGREVPRSYLTHLEQTVAILQEKLRNAGIDPNGNQLAPTPASNSPAASAPSSTPSAPMSAMDPLYKGASMMERVESSTARSGSKAPQSFLGASSGISFAKLMLAAVNFKLPDEKTPQPTSSASAGPKVVPLVDPSMLRHSTSAEPAVLASKDQAVELMTIHFSQSNPQLPVLHREEFIARYFQPIYGSFPEGVSLASDSTQINWSSLKQNIPESETWYFQFSQKLEAKRLASPQTSLEILASQIKVPRKFHIPLYFMNLVFAISSAVYNMQFPFMVAEGYKAAALRFMDPVYTSSDRLESLQAILLLTLYSLMRPAVPGVWYVLGSALRICVDLGLHTETSIVNKTQYDAYTMDMRRRLFWCCYSLDRQVCVYLGRPFGIPEESVHVPFPSTLDDAVIVRDINTHDYSVQMNSTPTYKIISLAIFQIRQIQAQVQSILYDRAELPRRFTNLDDWKMDINLRLDAWRENLKLKSKKFNCNFNFFFFELNYHHTKLILNGLSPGTLTLTTQNFFVVENASKEVISSYFQLYSMKAINYTWACVHNLFMAGTSYLYAIYHSPEVRERSNLQEIQRVTFECSLVLDSLIATCDAAAHCKDTFDILTAAVIRLRYTQNSTPRKIRKIPAASAIANSQPGQHVPEHLKDLLNNLPQDETPRAVSTIEEESFEDVKAEESTPVPPKSYQNGANQHSRNSELEWPTDEQDLDRFFEELDHLESPESSRSYCSPRGSNYDQRLSSSASEQRHGAVRQLNVQPGHSDPLPFYGQSGPPPQDPNVNMQSHFSGATTNNSQNGLYIQHQYGSPYETPPGTGLGPAPIVSAASSSQGQYSPYQQQITSPVPRGAANREGHKVFKMIYQVPTESIWDQFFATPYNNEAFEE
ncbi:unnamed protein product [Kuraishia capsulata CBS 1993]|uniref:Zn(2)-C6 fungal-type domain-containing protein n=1 Tax=Kuraishia capsulata CBS 1993 TaxID=1382522 RepID=W6MY46_9ASCO|nr:uncharacterized protein KUCA_T00005995001 [Kuraishia capsulata CBS 1993]CDK30000.1 unnamed protein product [Kuraishia capsulata CBS 1993]